MEKWQAFVLAIVLLVVIILVPPVVGLALVFFSSFWASFDANKLKAKEYESGFLKASPGAVFVGSLLLWIVVFPWYLYYRSQIKAGNLKRRDVSVVVPAISDIASEHDSLNR